MSNRKQAPHSKYAGFTLIEVLLALMIFAALSMAGYQVLSQVQQSSQISTDKTERLEAIQRAFIFIDNDFRQISPRAFSYQGLGNKIIHVGDGVLSSNSQGVVFTRLGWANPNYMFPRSQILKVGYRIIDNKLQRVWWHYPDMEENQEPLQRHMLDDVTNLSFRFYYNGQWQDSLEDSSPKGIELTLELSDYGKITRVYRLAGEINNDNNESAQREGD